MAFQGWPAEALEFFEELEADNSKAFWQANKSVYLDVVRAPMEELVAELEPEWGESRVMRPNRDIRFTADKSPYKTYIAAMVGDGYVQLTARGLGVGSGMWEMAPDQLTRYREAVDDDHTGENLAAIVAAARDARLQVMGHGVLKTAPKGYPRDHPRIELLRFKGLVAWQEWDAGPWLETRSAKDRVVDFLRLSAPLNEWLRRNVGSSTTTAREARSRR
jgi:uncharacterized protein (TIGR02453 family)